MIPPDSDDENYLTEEIKYDESILPNFKIRDAFDNFISFK